MSCQANNSSNSLNSFRSKAGGGSTVLLIRSYNESRHLFEIFLSTNLVLIFSGICVNVVICFIMLRNKRYKRNASNFFILHLAVTELVYRLLVFPVVIYVGVPALVIKSLHCKLASFLSETCGSAIFVSLVAIATDRYQHIVHPLESLKTKQKPVFLVIVVWVYASVVSFPHVITVDSVPVETIPEVQGMACHDCKRKRICDTPQSRIGQVSTMLCFLFGFFLPLTAVIALYIKIVVSLHQRSNNGKIQKVTARSKYKAVRMLSITVLAYVFSLGPAVFHAMLRSYGVLNNSSFEVMLFASWMVDLTTYTSSLANPLIYSYYNRDFRKELSRLFCRRKLARNVQQETVTFNISNRNS